MYRNVRHQRERRQKKRKENHFETLRFLIVARRKHNVEKYEYHECYQTK